MADMDEESFRRLSNNVVPQPVGVQYEDRTTSVSCVCETEREVKRQKGKADDSSPLDFCISFVWSLLLLKLLSHNFFSYQKNVML